MRCRKMHTCGNDYVFVRADEVPPDIDVGALARRISHRRRGVGSDGLVLWREAAGVDLFMEVFNADGSRAEVCGNALLCTARWLELDRGLREGLIGTVAGRHPFRAGRRPGGRFWVELGRPEFLLRPDDEVSIRGFPLVPVHMGNPHAVVFGSALDELDVAALAGEVARMNLFPRGVNVEFVEPLDEESLRVRVVERGSGETWACGSGACAVAAAWWQRRGGPVGRELVLDMRGGTLRVRAESCGRGGEGDTLWLGGEPVDVFSGVVRRALVRGAGSLEGGEVRGDA